MQDLLRKSNFTKLLHSTFTIQFEPEIFLEAQLIEVYSSPSIPDTEEYSFSLIFRTHQQGQYYTAAIYPVSHPELGEHFIFLSPLGPDSKGMTYNASFARHTS